MAAAKATKSTREPESRSAAKPSRLGCHMTSRAASAIGDDRLQRQAGGAVVPDSFTHGSSAQRVEWFRRGFDSGDLAACDTFSDQP